MTSDSYSSHVLRALAEATAFQPSRPIRVVRSSCLTERDNQPAGATLDAQASAASLNEQS